MNGHIARRHLGNSRGAARPQSGRRELENDYRPEIIDVRSRWPSDEQIAYGLERGIGVIVEQRGNRIYSLPAHSKRRGSICKRAGIILGTVDAIRVGSQRRYAVEAIDADRKR